MTYKNRTQRCRVTPIICLLGEGLSFRVSHAFHVKDMIDDAFVYLSFSLSHFLLIRFITHYCILHPSHHVSRVLMLMIMFNSLTHFCYALHSSDACSGVIVTFDEIMTQLLALPLLPCKVLLTPGSIDCRWQSGPQGMTAVIGVRFKLWSFLKLYVPEEENLHPPLCLALYLLYSEYLTPSL